MLENEKCNLVMIIKFKTISVLSTETQIIPLILIYDVSMILIESIFNFSGIDDTCKI